MLDSLSRIDGGSCSNKGNRGRRSAIWEVHTRIGKLKMESQMEEIHTRKIYIHGGEIHTEVNMERRHMVGSATQRKICMEGAHTPQGIYLYTEGTYTRRGRTE